MTQEQPTQNNSFHQEQRSSGFSYPRSFDCIVVGGGHAGVEASHIVARAGYQTLLITQNLDEIALMSCNPAIGGVAKGHIVREVDALGGLMGKIIDHTGIHYKMLNRSKGAAMWSPRAQADKALYKLYAKNLLEETDNLRILQDNVCELLFEDASHKRVAGVKTERGYEYQAPYVILTTGTFLRGEIHIGHMTTSGGRMGSKSSDELSTHFGAYGFEVSRLKTGTPPRIDARTIDFDRLEVQKPDEDPQVFSYLFEYDRLPLPKDQVDCYIAYTNLETQAIVNENLGRSAMYGGKIQSVGPRYCPSIEDKIVRFADKERHQIFLEPEGIDTNEVYLNGISTSLPEDVQWQMVRSMKGLEEAWIMRPGYAIEYDFCPPTQLFATLQTKQCEGLYFAGQINGTTGYEEAAGQGLVAGHNVIRKLRAMEPLILGRDEAYLGVLIDDLVTKGVEEPYRMFTSRAEYRLHLRQDNADRRLMSYAHEIGVDHGLYERMLERYRRYDHIKSVVSNKKTDAEICEWLKNHNMEAQRGIALENLFKRPQLSSEVAPQLFDFIDEPELEALDRQERRKLAMDIKYEGYLEREKAKTKRRMEAMKKTIPKDLDYDAIIGLKTEARQKLKKILPEDLGQASRISGVDPSDIDVLMLYIEAQKRKNRGQNE